MSQQSLAHSRVVFAPRRAAALLSLALLCASPALAAGPNVVVTTANSGAGSLRDAITYANGHPGTTISFQIPAAMAVGGVFSIKPTSPLPAITANGIIIDGGTQAAFGGNTNPAGPEVVVNGSMSAASPGLSITAANCQVKSLVVNGWTGHGISISGASATGAKVLGCYLGTDPAGTSAVANNQSGVSISGGAKTATIGGTAAASRNVLSGNGTYGVSVLGADATGVLIQGNYIGTDPGGTAAVGNNLVGVLISAGAHGNTIGGTVAGAGNLISGNVKGLTLIGSGTTANLVQGNFIGTEKTGASALPNTGDGVYLTTGADGNTIGGTAAAAKNVISGNGQNGVKVATSNNLVQGNYIGTNKDGNGPVPNTNSGVWVTGGHDNTIGGTGAGARNLVSGNLFGGVSIIGPVGANNKVQGNYVGVNASGTGALGNLKAGVILALGAEAALVGGTSAAARNLISGNDEAGVRIDGASTQENLVQGNYVGTNANGGAAVPNAGAGILLSNQAHDNTIGGVVAGAGNLASGNDQDGIELLSEAKSNNIIGNRVGTNFAGTGAVANGSHGIVLGKGCSDNSVGGTGLAANQVSGNGEDGVFIGGNANFVGGNVIGLNAAGTAALPNGGNGVRTNGSSNVIGGAGLVNTIAGNAGHGVLIEVSTSHHNKVAANKIGVNAAGTAAFPNGMDGVALTGGTHQNTVGGTLSSERNVISGNTGNGVHLWGGGTTGNVVSGNYIGVNAAGTAALANHASGVFFEGGASGPSGNAVGGFAGARNIISGNLLDGVRITPRDANHNIIQGNTIGLNAAGTAAVPNGQNGVGIRCASLGVTGTTINNNVISGNTQAGIYIHGLDTDDTIQGNTIGLDQTGTTAIANHGPGIWLVNDVSGCQIGGTLDTQRNVIAGNTQEGIRVETECETIHVQGNYIGTDATGLVDKGNGSHGISLADDTTHSLIGGNGVGQGNVISGNGGCGVRLTGATTMLDTVSGNKIGTNKDGLAALGNSLDGVLLEGGARAIVIGGSSGPSAGNLISGNLGNGIRFRDPGTLGSLVQANLIGTNIDGDEGIPNAKAGVEAALGAGPNSIGGVGSGQANKIGFNTQDGVLVRDATTHGISIRGNQIFSNGGLGINLETTGAANLVTPNDSGDGDSGPNGLQNFPLIHSAVSSPNVSVEVRLLRFLPGRNYAVDLYYGANTAADPSGNGEGPKYLGTKIVTTSAQGSATFTYSQMGPLVGTFFTATATETSSGNTSEFAKWKKVP